MNWVEEVKTWHDAAIQNRLQKPYSKGHTPVMLRVYPCESPECVIWKAGAMGDRERQSLQIASENMRISMPVAALLQSDAWFVKSDSFSKHFGLKPNLSYEEFQDAYWKILSTRFDGSQGNLPASVRSEAIFTVLKGPRIQQIDQFTYYSKGEGDTFVVHEATPLDECSYKELSILKNWWKETVH